MKEIIYKFAEKGMNISPEVYERIVQLENPLIFTIDLILKIRTKFSKNELFHLDEEFLLNYLNEDDLINRDNTVRNSNSNNNSNNKKTIQIDNNIPKQSPKNNDNLNNQVSLNSDASFKEDTASSEELKTYNPEISEVSKDIHVNKNTVEGENENDIKTKTLNEIIKKKSNQINYFNTSECFRNSNIVDTNYDFKIIQDTTNKSYTHGEISDLIKYFNNRFEKLSSILSKRPELKVPHKIKDIVGSTEFNTIGIINDIKTTKNGHRIMNFEDETGMIPILFHKDNEDLFSESEKLVNDEIIGLVGEKKGNLAISSNIIYPGVKRVVNKPMDFSIAFISDVHIGSLNFLDDAFSNFIKLINGENNEDSIGEDVKYLIIAGDLVDGIGIYPNQDKELAIKDIAQQYEEAARYLGDIRSDIKIILGPGNHDASRVAEPQTAIPEKYAKSLYQLNNVEFVSNPAVVDIEGFNTVIYHGRGFDDLAMTIKGMSHEKNDLLMEKMLKMRHLAPIYGERTPLASELEDYLVINETPDILHTGHVHINKYKLYNGIHLINSGTFQTQTEFQKVHNITPTAGIVPILHRGKYKELKFFNGN
ncbi:MAG: DNA-directed DNA polymerase II small subunit [Methanobrevibacter sp.]|jgi:DNA polymerase II small subunit|nr:DNA-directed DNA polymerase II small subunit [Candidatus Methanovirga meridionalis]